MNLRHLSFMPTSVGASVALACLCTVSAFGSNGPKATAINTSAAANLTEDAHAAVVQAYWTDDRLSSAKPMPVPRVDPSTVSSSNAKAPSGPAVFGKGAAPEIVSTDTTDESTEAFPLNQSADAQSDTTALPADGGFSYEMPFNNYRTGINSQYPYSTMGKLFFTIPAGASEPAGEYVCSATAVGNNRIVVTARHCMFDYATGTWYSNWVFYPEWKNGKSSKVGGKKGAWYPEWAATWTSSSTLSLTTGWDIGIFVMHDSPGTGCGGDKGKQLGQYTGYLGWVYGYDYGNAQFNAFGYPQASPFEGNYLYQDNGATGIVDPLGTTNVVEIGDPQTGGTSGGPWVIGFDPGSAKTGAVSNNLINGTNFDSAVNSFVWTNPNQPLAINGTVFEQNNFYNLYTYALSLTCS
ncbi:MAG: hypothetical protein ABSF17_10430 [Terracidiphilus sp.]|jgi:V8-like Glu-specific endopeptidase